MRHGMATTSCENTSGGVITAANIKIHMIYRLYC